MAGMGNTVFSVMTKIALAATLLCFVANLIAFATPYWIMAKVEVRERRKFDRLGLWTACFYQYSNNQGSQYRETLTGCHWLYSNYYKNSRDWLLPDWFICVQVLSAVVFVALMVATALLIMYFVRCYGTVKAESCALMTTAVLMIVSGLIETVVVVVFGVYGDDRDWLPRAELNYFSGSYAVAVFSAFCAFVAGAFLMVAALSARRVRENEEHARHDEREYAMSDRRQGSIGRGSQEYVDSRSREYVDNEKNYY